MIEVGVSENLENHFLMYWYVNFVEDKYSFGCKCTHNITHLEIYIVFDDPGQNKKLKGRKKVGVKILLLNVSQLHIRSCQQSKNTLQSAGW